MTRDETKQLLCAICNTYPNFKVTDATIMANTWTMILEPYDSESISKAFVDYCRSNTSGFAPSPSQLINLVATKVSNNMDEMNAWALVSKALRNSTYNAQEEFEKLPADIQTALGGSYQLHTWATDDSFNESVVQSHFTRSYKAVLERKRFDMTTDANLLESAKQKMIEGGHT